MGNETNKNRSVKSPAIVSEQDVLASLDVPQLLDSLPHGAYITDVHRRILYWNKAAEDITGWKADEVVGHYCQDRVLEHRNKDGLALCGNCRCPLHRCLTLGRAGTEPHVIFAQSKGGTRIPVETSVAPIRTVTGQIIGGIEIFRDLREERAELLRAKEVQDAALRYSLRPDARVTIDTLYQAEDLVGGDYYRLERLDDDHYGVLLADVTGHGTTAALNMMQIRCLWDALKDLQKEPGRLLTSLNQKLFPLTPQAGCYGTAVYMVLNASTGKFKASFAGHPPVAIFHPNGSTETFGANGEPLGMADNTIYSEAMGQILPGDAMLLYTDGATEIMNSEMHMLGHEGLIHIAKTQMGSNPTNFTLDRLSEQLLIYSNRIKLGDDLALIKIKMSPAH
jgi:phosphoserine phosphatase RsbU/P